MMPPCCNLASCRRSRIWTWCHHWASHHHEVVTVIRTAVSTFSWLHLQRKISGFSSWNTHWIWSLTPRCSNTISKTIRPSFEPFSRFLGHKDSKSGSWRHNMQMNFYLRKTAGVDDWIRNVSSMNCAETCWNVLRLSGSQWSISIVKTSKSFLTYAKSNISRGVQVSFEKRWLVPCLINLQLRHPCTSNDSHCKGGSCLANCWNTWKKRGFFCHGINLSKSPVPMGSMY